MTERRGDLAWIVANASPDKVLRMNVRTVSDGKVHTVTFQLPAEPVDTFGLPTARRRQRPARRLASTWCSHCGDG